MPSIAAAAKSFEMIPSVKGLSPPKEIPPQSISYLAKFVCLSADYPQAHFSVALAAVGGEAAWPG